MDQGDLFASSADGSGTSYSTKSGLPPFHTLRLEDGAFPVTGRLKTSDNGDTISRELSDDDCQSAIECAQLSRPTQWQRQSTDYHTHEHPLGTVSQQPPVRSSYTVDASIQTQLRAPVMPALSTGPRHMRRGDELSMPSSAGRLISTKSHTIYPRLEDDIPAAPSQLSGFPMLPLSRQQDSRNLQSSRSGMPLRAGPPFTMLAQEDDDPSFGGYFHSSVPVPKNEDMMDWTETASFQSPRNYRPRVTDIGHYANEADPNKGHLHWPTRPTIAGQGRRGSLNSMLSKVTASSGQSLVNLIDGAGFALTKEHLRQLWGGGQNASSTPTTTPRTNLTSGASLSP